MNTQITSKLTALGVALIVNCMMIGAVAYLFSGTTAHAATVYQANAAAAPARAQAPGADSARV
jgi:hypothetical protein